MFTTNIHATEFRARKYQGGFTTVDMLDGTSSKAAVFLETREKCDELIAAVSAAKSMLPSETSEPVPAPAPETGTEPTCLSLKPGTSTSCQRPAGHAGGHKNYAKDDYWPQDSAQDGAARAIAADLDEQNAGTDAE